MKESGVYPQGSLDFTSLYNELLVEDLPKDTGVILTFLGVTRDVGKEEKAVVRLEMQSYEEHASGEIRRICDEVKEKYSMNLVKIYHLIGEFKVGEPIIFAAVAGKSRDKALSALKEAVERYKTEPALWKREFYSDGRFEWLSGG